MPRDTERLGRSGEYVVAAFLSLYSDTVLIIPHGSHADLVAEFENKLLKFQVKTVTDRRLRYNSEIAKKTKKRSGWYMDMRRSGNTKVRKYKSKQVDIFALYIVPLGKIMFHPGGVQQGKHYSDRFVANNDSEDLLFEAVEQALKKA